MRSIDGVAAYRRLYSALARDLAQGRIPPGARLPSEHDLMRQYGLSRTTVRRALAELEREQRILRRKGSGTYALNHQAVSTVQLNAVMLHQDAPSDSRMQLRRFEVALVPFPITSQFPELPAEAFTIERTWSHNGTTYQLTSCYLPAVNALSRAAAARLRRLPLLTLLRHLDCEPICAEYSVSVADADRELSKLLKTSIGTPLLTTRTAFRDATKRLLAVEETYCPPDRVKLQAVLQCDPTRSVRNRWYFV